MIKRIVSILLLFVMLVAPMVDSNCIRAEGKNDEYVIEKSIRIKGKAFGVKEYTSLEPVTFDYHWLTTDCKNVYNNQLAEFASVLATDIYDTMSCQIEKKEAEDKTALLAAYGFQNVKYISVPEQKAEVDKDDTTAIIIGHRNSKVNSCEYDAYVVVIRGTNGTESEWSSDFDIGCDNTSYTEKTGDHPDWLNKQNHKAFDVVANRVNKLIKEYMKEHAGNPNAKKSILFTGHSRGGAVANILGAQYEREEISSCAYTFSTPNTTTASDVERKSVFNIINENDYISSLPLESWGFKRYGKDISLNISNHASAKELVGKLKNGKYSSASTKTLLNSFSKLADSRADLYDTEKKSNCFELTKSVDSIKKQVEKLDMEEYILFKSEGKKNYIILCPAVLMKGMSRIAANSDNYSDVFKIITGLIEIFPPKSTYYNILTNILSTLLANYDKLACPHETVCSYVIAKNTSSENSDDLGHTLKHIEAKEPTYDKEGNSEYYVCESCNRYFSNQEGTREIDKDSWIIKKLDDGVGSIFAEPSCYIIICAVVFLLAAIAMVFIVKRKQVRM